MPVTLRLGRLGVKRMTAQLAPDVDQQLVERVQKGDKRAFDLLVIKYQHKVLAVISRFIRDHAEAQDVAQEAFRIAGNKLAIKTKLVAKRGLDEG